MKPYPWSRTNWSIAPDGSMRLWWSGHKGIDPVERATSPEHRHERTTP